MSVLRVITENTAGKQRDGVIPDKWTTNQSSPVDGTIQHCCPVNRFRLKWVKITCLMMLGANERLRVKMYHKKECQVSLFAVNFQFCKDLCTSCPKCIDSPGIKWICSLFVQLRAAFQQKNECLRVRSHRRFWWIFLLISWKSSGRFGTLWVGCISVTELKSGGFDLRNSGRQSTNVTYFRSQETVWSALSVPWGMLGTGRVWTTPSIGLSCTMSLRCGKLTSMMHYGDCETSFCSITG